MTLTTVTPTLTIAALVSGIAGCGESDSEAGPDASTSTEPDSSIPDSSIDDDKGAAAAEAALFAAMNDGDYDAIDGLIGGFEAVLDRDPEHLRTTFLLGIAHQWKVAEADRDPASAPDVVQAHAPAAAEYLGRAREREPGNPFFNGFLGAMLVNAPDPAVQAQGEQLILAARAAFPKFGLFLLGWEWRDAPYDDEMFTRGVEAQWTWLNECFGTDLDRNNPDIEPLLAGANFDGDTFCWDGESTIVPHGVKAVYLIFGDLLVKQGETDAAQVMYENAKLLPGYQNWPHRDALEARLASDLAERSAFYRDGDPATDPAIAKPPLSCTFCHQQ